MTDPTTYTDPDHLNELADVAAVILSTAEFGPEALRLITLQLASTDPVELAPEPDPVARELAYLRAMLDRERRLHSATLRHFWHAVYHAAAAVNSADPRAYMEAETARSRGDY